MVQRNIKTFHLHYDLEKGGYRGYDRRHYPEKNRFAFSDSESNPRSRMHISSAPSRNMDEQWRPHGRHIEPKYTNFGLDWQSRIHYIAPPEHPDAKPTLPVSFIERNIRFTRPYPQNWQRTTNEWIYFTDESIEHNPSKRNYFADIYLRSIEDLGNQDIHMTQIGYKKKVLDKRNGLPKKSDGDKSYHNVEESTDFHKFGSTLPVVEFGHEKTRHESVKTLVQMKNEHFHVMNDKEFAEQERKREQENIIDEVAQLDNWKPAPRVKSAFKVLDLDPNDKHGGRYRPRIR
ncbi:unnamed protein product [Adineta steineri]|uniref:Uncharacterized protein n=1 Tax=Adineta steineri TaxID=433720 RepID=A0A813UPP0_9BILA|nr:unnamed protein product [Adineta steineri]CAF1018737.1 unnamed protein product [Adineta steineri]